MLAVSSLRNPNNEREGEMEDSEFPDLSGTNLLDSIDFDDLFLGISVDGDVLPDLEILGEFSLSDESEVKVPSLSVDDEDFRDEHLITAVSDLVSASSSPIQEDDTKHESVVPSSKQLPAADHRGRKSKNPPGKRKVKVDWTPELHRRFVQAVEQLGVDKAVPSRILELMGIDCLTRHNIASHLQKYRSHRKHLLAREAEAASWSQRRQMYGGGGSVGKRECGWSSAPTMGFPPVTHFRPLHVWGHPSLDQSVMPIWPKHLTPPPPLWSPPPHDPPSFWIPPHHHHRFPGPAVTGIPPGGIYKVEHPGVGFPTAGQTLPQPPSDIHPSKESVDAAIGDVLSKPWLPLPLGLKPPSTDGVMVELQRQGISKVPPSCVA